MRPGARAELRNRAGAERGSALLIVFVFAAMVAIMLYKEMPVAAFEAERNREQLVIDRGGEYAHAVKLFVRKVGTYPASIDALESTNRMRFLRHRFKDPLTGKDDWRLLHAAPNGQLIDSKVNPIANNQNANGSTTNGSSSSGSSFGSSSNSSFGSSSNSSFGSSSGSSFGSSSGSSFGSSSGSSFGSSSNSSFGSSSGSSFGSSSNSRNSASGDGFFDSSSASNAAPEVSIPAVPQRPPAIAANGGANGQAANAPQLDQNPMTPLLSPGQTAENGQAGANGANGSTAAAGTGQAGTAAAGQSPMDTVRNLLNNPNSPPAQTSSSSSQMGRISSGGIAGVASKAGGHSIKTVNDQSEYSLWEFYYDPTKDAMRAIAGAQANMGAGGPNAGVQNRPAVTTFGSDPSTTASPTTNSPMATSTNPPQ